MSEARVLYTSFGYIILP